MILSELFDTNIRPAWHDRSQDGFSIIEAEFPIGDDLLRVQFKRYRPDPNWGISFYRNGKYDLTGGGSSFIILSVVQKAVVDFIHTRRPLELSFTAARDEPSRIRLYSILAQNLLKIFPEYELKERSLFKNHYFEFVKNGGPDPIEREYLGEPITGEENKPRKMSNREREELDRILDELGDLL